MGEVTQVFLHAVQQQLLIHYLSKYPSLRSTISAGLFLKTA